MWWLVLIVFAFLVPEILSTILDSRLGRAIAAQIESRGRLAEPEGSAERLRELEGEVERLSEEVRRLADESDFLQKLFADRPASPSTRLPPPGDRTP